MILTDDEIAVFWSRIDMSKGPDGCWYMRYVQKRSPFTQEPLIKWPTQLLINGKHYKSINVAYTLTKGALNPGKVIRHRCGNGGCMNPAHMLSGTAEEKKADLLARRMSNIPEGAFFTYEEMLAIGARSAGKDAEETS